MGVGQPEDVHPFLPEADAEAVIVRRKMRGEIDEVHRRIFAGAGGTVKRGPRLGILLEFEGGGPEGADRLDTVGRGLLHCALALSLPEC
jgi:hypothetical protein